MCLLFQANAAVLGGHDRELTEVAPQAGGTPGAVEWSRRATRVGLAQRGVVKQGNVVPFFVCVSFEER